MDRESALKLCKKYYLEGGITNEEIVDTIFTYCLDKGKKQEDISKFLGCCFATGIPYKGLFEYILEVYKKEYFINLLESAPTKFGGRNILLIF